MLFAITYLANESTITDLLHHDSTETPESVASAFARLWPARQVVECRYGTPAEMEEAINPQQ